MNDRNTLWGSHKSNGERDQVILFKRTVLGKFPRKEVPELRLKGINDSCSINGDGG
jgi:hypothetical protein